MRGEREWRNTGWEKPAAAPQFAERCSVSQTWLAAGTCSLHSAVTDPALWGQQHGTPIPTLCHPNPTKLLEPHFLLPTPKHLPQLTKLAVLSYQKKCNVFSVFLGPYLQSIPPVTSTNSLPLSEDIATAPQSCKILTYVYSDARFIFVKYLFVCVHFLLRNSQVATHFSWNRV